MTDTYKIGLLRLPSWVVRLFPKRARTIPPHLLATSQHDMLSGEPSLEVGVEGLRFREPKSPPQIAAEELMDILSVLIRKAAIQGHTKPQLVAAIRGVLPSYHFLAGTMLEVAVLLFIGRSVSRYCPFDLRMDELRKLWRV
jgi:hypothetical protein